MDCYLAVQRVKNRRGELGLFGVLKLALHMPELSHFRGRGKSCAKLISKENWCEISHLKKSKIWPICGNFEVSDRQFSAREIIIAFRLVVLQ